MTSLETIIQIAKLIGGIIIIVYLHKIYKKLKWK